MNIGEPLKELGDIDYSPLRDRILSLDDKTWNEKTYLNKNLTMATV